MYIIGPLHKPHALQFQFPSRTKESQIKGSYDYLLLKEVGKGQEEEQGNYVSINWENNLANATVEGNSRDHMETSISKLQSQHGYVQLKLFGY